MDQVTLVFDSAGPEIFLWIRYNEQTRSICERAPRRGFLTHFPERIAALLDDLPLDANSRVYLGIGPGSFTGLKSGAALVGSVLFARGVHRVHTVSSLDIRVIRVLPDKQGVCLALIPFHAEEAFLSLIRHAPTAIETLVAPALVPLSAFASWRRQFADEPDFLVSDEPLPEPIERMLLSLFPRAARRMPAKDLSPAAVASLPVIKTVDLRRDPLYLQYIASPAVLSGEDERYYVSLP